MQDSAFQAAYRGASARSSAPRVSTALPNFAARVSSLFTSSQYSPLTPAAAANDDYPGAAPGGAAERARNWFGVGTGGGGSDTECFGLTRIQRLVGLAACLALATLCFLMSFAFVPLIVVVPHKFAAAFTLGSVLCMAGFAINAGWRAFGKSLLTPQRLPFSGAYLTSMLATLYFALGSRSYVLTVIAAAAQLVALAWYIASYIPGATSALGWLTTPRSILPI